MASALLVLFVVLAIAGAFASGVRIGQSRAHHAGAPDDARPAMPMLRAATSVAFEPIAQRGCRGLALADHASEWRAAMASVGTRLRKADVGAVVFVHGTFTGSDPLSAVQLVERVLPPRAAAPVAGALRRVTRAAVERVLGDLGHFSAGYTDLFEHAVNDTDDAAVHPIACTTFAWSSENHHLGRVEAALGLLRVLATHHEIGGGGRVLVLGHSHAGQIFALVTQMIASVLTAETVRDVARVRRLDVTSYDVDRLTLARAPIDFVTFGSPVRYAWAETGHTRALHVVSGGDWVQRIGGASSDFPPFHVEDRRANAALEASLGASFEPSSALRALWTPPPLEARNVVLVDYGDAALLDRIGTGLGHGGYTRLDAMLFHADLVTRMLYESTTEPLAPGTNGISA
ncbi:MAG: hypothetical protein JST00_04985 [Deltaproteobacteria bacterium]|nr:hypothetical protein [Deltaproteobacteria bacterium]